MRFEYAGLLAQAGRLPEVRQQYELLVAEHPSVSEYRIALADLLIRLRDFEPARNQLRTLLGQPEHARRPP